MALDKLIAGKEVGTLEGMAQAAEAAERYEDMVKIMAALVKKQLEAKKGLTADQRNLLSVAYKNVVGAKRSSWRMLTDDTVIDNLGSPDTVNKYKKVVEDEMEKICNDILAKLKGLHEQNKTALDNAPNNEKQVLAECQVFYLKMVGDYYRYLTEAFSTNDTYKEECDKHYKLAMDLAKEHLEATHPTRLGLALNYSVCYYEILNKPKDACELAKSAFDEAIEKLDSLNDVSYKDSTLIMQLLRDNLTIWNQNTESSKNENGDDA